MGAPLSTAGRDAGQYRHAQDAGQLSVDRGVVLTSEVPIATAPRYLSWARPSTSDG